MDWILPQDCQCSYLQETSPMLDFILNGVHISVRLWVLFRNCLNDISLKRDYTISMSSCVRATCFLTEELCLHSSQLSASCGSHLAVFKVEDDSFLTDSAVLFICALQIQNDISEEENRFCTLQCWCFQHIRQTIYGSGYYPAFIQLEQSVMEDASFYGVQRHR